MDMKTIKGIMKRYANAMANSKLYSVIKLSGPTQNPLLGFKGNFTIDPGYFYAPYVSMPTTVDWSPPDGSLLLGPWKFIDSNEYGLCHTIIKIIGVVDGKISNNIDMPGSRVLFVMRITPSEQLASLLFWATGKQLTSMTFLTDGERWWGINELLDADTLRYSNPIAYRYLRLSYRDQITIKEVIAKYVHKCE